MTSPKSHMPRVSIGSSVASSESAPVSTGCAMGSTPSPDRSNSSNIPSPHIDHRKRNGDHLDDEDSDEHVYSPLRTSNPSAPPYPCICTPEPKIPRPRNCKSSCVH
ncbi:hypothetical protein K461DRAFT_254550 [Myriangium duriaei CBS 260.36]|uniref:Uncharacterized protein n=1 Tax=Myriangium duriaei CBS 260.36 TaxID=1168546 RepID=A0A9P4J562_9PEZI|nr:hypothetical protein K461DRAFT_254550 [Myriangium duriaei CBS 260.36]